MASPGGVRDSVPVALIRSEPGRGRHNGIAKAPRPGLDPLMGKARGQGEAPLFGSSGVRRCSRCSAIQSQPAWQAARAALEAVLGRLGLPSSDPASAVASNAPSLTWDVLGHSFRATTEFADGPFEASGKGRSSFVFTPPSSPPPPSTARPRLQPGFDRGALEEAY
jgi:hypothetical protein